MMEDLAYCFGSKAWEHLPESRQVADSKFFWGGCTMHKELNSVKGGNSAMMLYWTANNVPGPTLLANKDNAAALLLQVSDTSSPAVQCTLEITT